MRIESVQPEPPPREIRMTFPFGDGWAIVAALRHYAEYHPNAHNVSDWLAWAAELDEELRL